MARAIAAGKRTEFVWWFGEAGRALRDPTRALHVGAAIRQTAFPGGFVRQWHCGCLLLKYVIFPDQEIGWIYHIDFDPRNWA